VLHRGYRYRSAESHASQEKGCCQCLRQKSGQLGHEAKIATVKPQQKLPNFQISIWRQSDGDI
jgi:hypothetical protein